jgi:hypothetical protein
LELNSSRKREKEENYLTFNPSSGCEGEEEVLKKYLK